MSIMKQYGLMILFIISIAGCKSKKPVLSGDEPVEINDFIDFFPDANLPYEVVDKSLLKKENDSLLISYKVFTQFVPDSILSEVFGKKTRPKIYPLAKYKGDETYLFAKAIAPNKKVMFVLGFDKKNNYIATMPLLTLDQSSATTQTASMDTRYTLTKSVSRKNTDGSVNEGKDVYVLNGSTKSFTLIMTDALDDKITELTNPIDTFSRKQKYAADYGRGKLNLVSIRDGRKKGMISFFIHFEKSNGDCTGELKGEALMKSPTLAEYMEKGDPCILQFKFSASSVTVKELEGCGSRRGLRCSFDGTYPRKKEAKPVPAKIKSVKKK
ncbi:MAG: hypothetical protein ACSLE0_06540 [Chitinophagaceae bacterium]